MSTNEALAPQDFFSSIKKKTRDTFELVKFSHTIFALPFAMVAYLLSMQGKLFSIKLIWILLCMIFARTAAMAFNRWIDAPLDAKNPRTQNRHLPAGQLSPRYVAILVIISSLAFLGAASQLNLLCLVLSPLCLAILFFYSITKRFTYYTQVFLGFSLGMAPLAVTIAISGTLTLASILLGLSVVFWVAGFDTLYALQDVKFDQEQGLFSLPVKLGVKKSFYLAKFLHVAFLLLLFFLGWLQNFSWIYWSGYGICFALTAWQHVLLKNDLKKIDTAFFTANGMISLIFMFFTGVEIIYLH